MMNAVTVSKVTISCVPKSSTQVNDEQKYQDIMFHRKLYTIMLIKKINKFFKSSKMEH